MKKIEAELKKKYSVWMKPSTLDIVHRVFKDDNCISGSEFIEKAVLFYYGYICAANSKHYLPNVVTSTVKATVRDSEERIVRIIFKLAVELAMTMNVVAFTNDISKETLSKLRGECINEVKRLNGTFSFDDAYNWQNG